MRRSDRNATRSLATRMLAVLVSLSLAWTPWALTWGQDAFSAIGLSGQAFGEQAAAAVQAPTLNGNAIVLPGGQSMDLQALFPDSGGDSATFSGLYGEDEAVVAAGRQAQADWMVGNNPPAQAFQTLRESVVRSNPDMSNDPLWSQTDDIADHLEEIAESFADCSYNVLAAQQERQVHIPDLRTCEKVVESGSCSLFHDYSLPPASPFVTAWGGAAVSHCGVGCEQVTYQHSNEFVEYGRNYPPVHAGQTFGFNVADQARVNAVQVSLVAEDPAIRFEQTRPPEWGLRADRIAYQYSASFPGYQYSAASPNAEAWGGIPRPVLTAMDATNGLRNGGALTIANTLQARNDGSDIWYSGSWRYNVTVAVYYTPLDNPLTDWGWTNNLACQAHFDRVSAGVCAGTVECIGAPPLAANGCYQDTGVQVCPWDLAQPPVSASAFCREISVTSDCSVINTGPMACWTDTQGQVQCPENDGAPSNCAALEDNPNCGFMRSECMEGATDPNGDCYVFTETWDCGNWQSVPVIEQVSSLDCAGPVRCMGEDCLDPARTQSEDFAEAVAALQTVQMAVTDSDCTDIDNCRIFPGEGNECKKAVGGVVNCCTTPDGVSLTEYMSLVMSIGKVDSAILGLDKGNVIRGGWETLRDPLASTWTAVKDGFTSVANNLMGEAAPALNDLAAELSLDAFKQQVMQATVQFVADTFGPSAANAIFATTGGGAAVDAAGNVATETLTLGGPIGAAMMYVMYAYMIYAIVMILIKIIWTCEQEEFELGAKRELKGCHKVGSYCKSDILGLCIESREAYCCFNTPLARIVNEQIRPQLGRGWGTAKSPDCSGIAVRDFARVNWEQVNLDEWLAILTATGQFPTLETLNVQALTGTGNTLNTDGQRLDAVTRTTGRSDGLDAGEIRSDAEAQLWGTVDLP